MNNVISEYQKWKQQGEDLRVQAKQAMESRFRELLAEAVKIAEEYRSDFGGLLKPAPPVTSFRYKAHAKAKKGAKAKAPAPKAPAPREPSAREPAKAAPREEPKPQKPDPKSGPKIPGLQKRLATAKKKLDDAKTAGKPTRVLEDKIYEIEDELRLAGQAQ
jgi:hypothetical protein